MCGINGFFNYLKLPLAEEEELVKKMNRVISHRGPDDSGIWSDADRRVFFGHQRLSILDLSPNGHQPMIGLQGTVIVYNGEIYNFKSLKAGFTDRAFFSETDTEVLLYLYERDGQHCLDHVNG
ncbi:MAG: asparagine synthase (glutamine-hydrolyzing), partial [bacterium]